MWAAILRLLAMEVIAKKISGRRSSNSNAEGENQMPTHEGKNGFQNAMPYALAAGVVVIGTLVVSSMIENKDIQKNAK